MHQTVVLIASCSSSEGRGSKNNKTEQCYSHSSAPRVQSKPLKNCWRIYPSPGDKGPKGPHFSACKKGGES